MEPKFQSSFIPKGPLVSSVSSKNIPSSPRSRGRSLLSLLATIIFILSILLALGMFGYKYYLGYSIERMTASLEEARRTLEPSVIAELTSLDRRIISTKELVSSHKILSPLLEFLEDSTPLDVRFRDFSYSSVDGNLEIRLKGEARSYAVLALQADIFSRSDNFKNPIFSDLTLNDRGEVLFSFQATVDPRLLSYERGLEIQEAQPTPILETSEPEGEASSSPDSLDVSEN